MLLFCHRYFFFRDRRRNLFGFRFLLHGYGFGFRPYFRCIREGKPDHALHIGTAGFLRAFRSGVYAATLERDPFRCNAFLHEVIAHGAGTAQRQLFIERRRTAFVRPAGNDDRHTGIRLRPPQDAPHGFVLALRNPRAFVLGKAHGRTVHHRIACSRFGNCIPALRP